MEYPTIFNSYASCFKYLEFQIYRFNIHEYRTVITLCGARLSLDHSNELIREIMGN